jgi:hypothetical protein
MGLLDWLRGRGKQKDAESGKPGLRAVHGASVASKQGQVVYNMLDPWMQQFMGRCVGAIKKAGLSAKGTGQFSVKVGDTQAELRLDEFWADFSKSQDAAVFERVVAAAKTLATR